MYFWKSGEKKTETAKNYVFVLLLECTPIKVQSQERTKVRNRSARTDLSFQARLSD